MVEFSTFTTPEKEFCLLMRRILEAMSYYGDRYKYDVAFLINIPFETIKKSLSRDFFCRKRIIEAVGELASQIYQQRAAEPCDSPEKVQLAREAQSALKK